MDSERGQALPLALIALAFGALVVGPFLTHTSTGLLSSRIYRQAMIQSYSAEAGVEYAIRRLQDGQSDMPELTVNNDTVNVTIEDEGNQTYRIISTATSDGGSSTTIECLVEVGMTGGTSMFDYAAVSVDGDIRLDQDSRVYSDSYPELDGGMYAHGDIDLNNSSILDGDAAATGTIDVASGASAGGTQVPGADPLPGLDEQQAQLDALVAAWKAETQDHGCDDLTCVSYTYTGNNWQPSPGTYADAQHAKKSMTISGSGGDTWKFQDTVCAGVDTNKNLVIGDGNPQVVFEGPVKVGRNLDISWGSGENISVTFKDAVCVGNLLRMSSDAVVTFEGPVYVGGDLMVSGWSNTIAFEDTVYVGNDLTISEEKVVELGGTVYVASSINLNSDGNAAQIGGGQHIIADNDISLEGRDSRVNPDVVDAADIPFLVSTTGDITLNEGNETTAIAYAPNGAILVRGYDSRLYGCAVGQSVRIRDWGPNEIEYALGLAESTHLPGGGAGGEVSVVILSWK